MAPSPTRILLVGSSELEVDLCCGYLERASDLIVVGRAYSVAGGSAMAADLEPDVVVAFSRLRHGSGWDVLVAERIGLFLVLLSTPGADKARQGDLDGYCTVDMGGQQLIEGIRSVAAGTPFYPSGLIEIDIDRPAVPTTPLTPKENEVLQLLAQAGTITTISQALVVSHHTTRNHLRALRRKFDASSQLEVVVFAARAELIDLVRPVESTTRN